MEGMRRMIDTTFAIMLRRQMFLPIPPVLAEYALATRNSITTEVEFTGALAMFQRENESEQILSTAQKLQFLAQFDSNVLYQLDATKAARQVFEIDGTTHLQRTKAEVDKILAQKAQEEAQQQQLAVANSVADTAQKLTPALTAIQGGKQAA